MFKAKNDCEICPEHDNKVKNASRKSRRNVVIDIIESEAGKSIGE